MELELVTPSACNNAGSLLCCPLALSTLQHECAFPMLLTTLQALHWAQHGSVDKYINIGYIG
jgi:hypothetical protein